VATKAKKTRAAKPATGDVSFVSQLKGIGENLDLAQIEKESAALARDEDYFFPRTTIHPDPNQPRDHITPESVEELREQIKAEGGLIHSITVRPHPDIDGEWMIIDGERRWTAAEGVLAEIPCKLRLDREDPVERFLTQLRANSGEPLTPLQEARAYKNVMDADVAIAEAEGREPLSQAQLAKALGKPRASVGDRLRLLAIGPWLELLNAGKITVSQAVEVGRFSAVPDKYGRQAIKKTAEHLRYTATGVKDNEFSLCPLAEFKGALNRGYTPFLFRLQPNRFKQGGVSKAEQDRHDKECSCGRIRFAEYSGSDAADHCGNPDWWKPIKTAQDEKAAAADRAREKGDTAKARQNGEIRAWMELPKGVRELDVENNEEKDYVQLTSSEDGKWHINEWPDRRRFDPRDLEIDASKLAVIRESGGIIDPVYTSDHAAVERACLAFADRVAPRRREVVLGMLGEFDKAVAAKRFAPIAIAGTGLQHALLVVAQRCARDLIGVAQVLDIFVPTGLRIAQLSERAAEDGGTLMREWCAVLDDTAAGALLTAVLKLATVDGEEGGLGLSAGLLSIEHELATANDKDVTELRKQPVPWLKLAKGKELCPKCASPMCDGPDDVNCEMAHVDEDAPEAAGSGDAGQDDDAE
jgi:ParB/RepB/Spo0J family partition protein